MLNDILIKFIQVIVAAVITERSLEGLHELYWIRVYVKPYLVGNNDGEGILEGWMRAFVRCKFCQSWWMAWVVSLIMIVVWEGWSFHWVWIGIVSGSFASKIHDIFRAIKDRGI